MAIDTGSLYYLVDPFLQIENVNGKPIVGGHVEVFEAGTDNKIITYADWDGTRHPFKIPLGSDGRAVILVDPGYRYDAYVYDSFNNLVCSRLNIIPLSDGDITIDGMGQVYHDETLSGKGTPNSPLTVISGGKVYGGIYPIDVNNELDMISADNVPLGVQSPLYFAQDDDEGLVIALSSVPVPEGTMNESAFGYQDGQITSYNGSAFSAGLNYEAGSYVDIVGNTINVTGLQPAGNYQSAGDYVVHDELSSYATQDWVENQSYMKEYMKSAFYPSTSNPSGYLTAHQDISNKLDVSAFSTVSGDFITAIPSEYVTENTLQSGLSSKLDSTAFSTVSSTFLTAHQSLDGLMSADLLEIAYNKITGYNGTAFAGQGGGVSGDFTLVEGNGIQLTDDPIAQTTTISVSGDYATNTQLQNVSAEITGMVPSIVDSNTISYSAKPTADPIYAENNNLKNVNSIQGDRSYLEAITAVNSYLIVPNAITACTSNLEVQNVITAGRYGLTANGLTANTDYGLSANGLTASPNYGLTANGLTASPDYGLTANGLTADVMNSGFSANGISAGKGGPLCIEGPYEIMYARGGSGFTFSSRNTAFGTAQLGTAIGNSIVQMYAPKFEARNISGAGFSIEASGAKGYNESGNVVWDTNNLQAKNIISYSDTKTAQGGLNGNIILTTQPSTAASNLTSSPYVIMDAAQASYFAAYGPSAQTPTIELKPDAITFDYAAGNAKTTVGYNDVKQELSGSSWTLTGAIQKRELEYDTATSAITAIAGSAIGGACGGAVPEGVMSESGLEYNAVNEISGYNGSAIAQYGAEKQWLVHDDTLVHVSNSAQYALGVNVSALQRLMSIDETVLFSSDGTPLTAFTVSEPLTNFNEVVFYVAPNTSLPAAKVSIPMVGYNISNLALTYNSIWDGFRGGIQFSMEYNNNNMSAFTYKTGAWFGWTERAVNTGNYYDVSLYKIIGIGRKQ